MATLGISDRAFGNVGISITEDLDLVQIAADLSAVLGVPFSFDGLNLTALQDPQRLGLITASGNVDPAAPDTLVLGDAGFLSPATANGTGDAVSLFERLALTDDTMDGFAELLVPFFELQQIPTNYDLSIDRDAADPHIAAGFTQSYYSYYSGSGYYFQFVLTGPDEAQIDIDTSVSDFDFSRLAGWQAYVYISDTQDATVIGSAQDDKIFGGDGNDSIVGGLGNDALTGGRGTNTVDGGEGDDFLISTVNPVLIDFQVGLVGDAQDSLIGGPGNDGLSAVLPGTKTFDGGAGKDTLFTGPGQISLTGGTESDRFYLAREDQQFDFDSDPNLDAPYVIGGIPYLLGFGEDAVGGTPTGDLLDRDTIEDFSSASNLAVPAGQADLVVAQVDVDALDQQLSRDFSFDTSGSEGGVATASFVEQRFDIDLGSIIYQDQTLLDTADAISFDDLLIRVVPPDADAFFSVASVDFLDFGREIFASASGESISRPGSFELAFWGNPGSTAQSLAFTEELNGQGQLVNVPDYFVLTNFRLAATDEAVQPDRVLDGQDKIDLTYFGFTGAAIGDILFTSIELFEDQAYTNATTASDFFADAGAGVDRAVHVEKYFFGEGLDVNIYVDTDGNGDYDPFVDLFFQLQDPTYQGGNTPVGIGLTAADLYNDPAADGSGSGIFIFNTEQYDLWFDPGLEPPSIGIG